MNCPRRNFDAHVENAAGPAEIIQRDHVAAVNILNRIQRQIQSRSRTGSACFHIAAMRLDVTNARRFPGRLDRHGLAAAQRAAVERAGDDRANSLQLEYSIHRQPRFADIGLRRCIRQYARERCFQFVEAAPADNRRWDDWRIGKRGLAQFFADRGDSALLVLREINFRERDDGATDSKIGENLQMLFRLRHPAIVGRDDQQRQINRAHARDHILHEIFVARHVNDPEHER